MPKLETMLLQTGGSTFFGKADLMHAYYQIALHPDDARIDTYCEADSHSLFKTLRALQGFKDSALHWQVHATEFLPSLRKICTHMARQLIAA